MPDRIDALLDTDIGSRRNFLKITAAGTASAVLAGCRGRRVGMEEGGPKVSERLGPEEKGPFDTNWTPDGHVTYLQEGDNLRVWTSAGQESRLWVGHSWDDLVDQGIVLGPDRSKTKEGLIMGYRGITSVVRRENQLICTYHTEYHRSQNQPYPFVSENGVAISNDEGRTWENPVEILQGTNPKKQLSNETRTSGAGQPCAVVRDGELWVYYVDWNGKQADAIHLAKVSLGEAENPDAWMRYNRERGFIPAIENVTTAVVLPSEGAVWAALPSVSWNESLSKWLMVYESNDGFYRTVSDDGLNWGGVERVFEFPKTRLDSNNPGDVWYSYPTYISPEMNNDQVTGNKGLLIYARGEVGKPHTSRQRQMVVKES